MADALHPPVYAGFWRRKVAYGIDSFLVIALLVAAVMVLGNPAQAQDAVTLEQLRAAGLISDSSSPMLGLLFSLQQGGGAGAFKLPSLDYVILIFTLVLAISCLYNIAFVASRWQATPGKYWLGMRITRTDGGRVGILRSTARHAATGITMGVLGGLGYVTMAFRPDKAALHDLMCGTRVVRSTS